MFKVAKGTMEIEKNNSSVGFNSLSGIEIPRYGGACPRWNV